MTLIYIYTFLAIALTSLISFAGAFTLSIRADILKKYVFIFMSVAIGALLGDAFIHLIPESFEKINGEATAGLLVISGILLFFIIEKFLHWHHHGDDPENHIHPVGKLVLFSDGFHNFIDGIIIASSFMLSPEIGIATTLAVILHEIPQEIGDFAVLVHSGYTKSRALWLNFLSALVAILGAVFVFILGEYAENMVNFFAPIAAGGFIYIALADLIPELNKKKDGYHSIVQIISILSGILAMLMLVFLE